MARDALVDVLGLGAVAIDDLIYVDQYPGADAKVHVRDRQTHHGGQTGTALVAASRFGVRTSYAGAMGLDAASDLAIENLAREGVDVAHCRRVAGLSAILSTIIVGDGGKTRAIFADTRNFRGADPGWPAPEVIRSARVLFLDHWGVDGMIRAARIARAAGIPIVSDFERNSSERFGELFDLADHLVIGREFASALTGESDPARAARLLRATHPVVVVTDGAEGCWGLEGDAAEPMHVPAFRVEVRDTTGCGDVFHGVYAAALAQGEPLLERMILASASAARKAERPGGQPGIPDRAAIREFRARHGR